MLARRTVLLVYGMLVCGSAAGAVAAAQPERPNIIWITCEDMSPNLGCYGDAYARSPAIDALAAEGVRFTRCFTHSGVCAPSRSGLITGMYPPSIGTQHMRSKAVLPTGVKCFSERLREAGYYCTNNAKTDYNFPVPAGAWDAGGAGAHWKNRPAGKPFFAVFNLATTHESRIRAPEAEFRKNTARLTADQRHDPVKAPLPPYFPDTPLVRRDVARYYDNITAMDYEVADLLQELKEAGLADQTIVFFFSDHGAGLPRGKRWLYDSGVHVPLIVRIPPAWRDDGARPGTTDDRLAALVDFAPTVLSLAGVPIPDSLPGRAFLGPRRAEPREYVFGCRDRMGERVDLIRSVRDRRFKYIRNYEWWRPYAQHIAYAEEMPTMREWRRAAAEEKLNVTQALFMAPQKPPEELYDCDADPHEVRNLAGDAGYAETLRRMRAAHENWVEETGDTGFLPEYSLQSFMKSGSGWRENVELRHAIQRIHALLRIQFDEEWAANHDPESVIDTLLGSRFTRDLGRGVTAYRIRAIEVLGAVYSDRPATNDLLLNALGASESPVRIAAARSIAKVRRQPDGTVDAATLAVVRPIYAAGVRSENEFVRHAAALAIDDLGPQAAEFLDDVRELLKSDHGNAALVGEYILRTRSR